MARTKKQPQKWHPEDIKAAVRKKGETLASLARKKELSDSCTRNALRVPLPSGERAISEFLGIPLFELWPDRWTQKGERIRPRYAHKLTTSIAGNSNCNGYDKTKKIIYRTG